MLSLLEILFLLTFHWFANLPFRKKYKKLEIINVTTKYMIMLLIFSFLYYIYFTIISNNFDSNLLYIILSFNLITYIIRLFIDYYVSFIPKYKFGVSLITNPKQLLYQIQLFTTYILIFK